MSSFFDCSRLFPNLYSQIPTPCYLAGAAIDYSLFILLRFFIPGMHYQVANSIAISVSIFFVFLLKLHFPEKPSGRLFQRFMGFYLAGSIGIGINIVSVFYLAEFFSMDVYAAKALVLWIVPVTQTVLYSFFSFDEIFCESSEGRDRMLVIFASSIPKLFFGYVFFGSVDSYNLSQLPMSVFLKNIPYMPYFPVIPALLWVSGVINIFSPLPLTFCIKFIPIMSDVFLGLLIYEFLRKSSPRIALKGSMLYALSPICLIINSFHGQYDSVFLFVLAYSFYVRERYQETAFKYFSFGSLFTLSFMIKPVPLMFYPIIFQPLEYVKRLGSRRYLFLQGMTLAGIAFVSGCLMAAFWAFGFEFKHMFGIIIGYSKFGWGLFGLPRALHNLTFLADRSWVALVLSIFSVLYYLGKIGIFEMMVFSYAVAFGVSNLAPQYLIWPVPFLIIARFFKISALYNIIVSPFLLFFYMHPGIPNIPFDHFENMGTFAALNPLSWLMPSAGDISKSSGEFILSIGNYAIPGISICIALFLLYGALTNSRDKPVAQPDFESLPTLKMSGNFVFLLLFLLVIGLSSQYFFARQIPNLGERFARTFINKISEYNLTFSDSRCAGANFQGHSIYTITALQIDGKNVSLIKSTIVAGVAFLSISSGAIPDLSEKLVSEFLEFENAPTYLFPSIAGKYGNESGFSLLYFIGFAAIFWSLFCTSIACSEKIPL